MDALRFAASCCRFAGLQSGAGVAPAKPKFGDYDEMYFAGNVAPKGLDSYGAKTAQVAQLPQVVFGTKGLNLNVLA